MYVNLFFYVIFIVIFNHNYVISPSPHKENLNTLQNWFRETIKGYVPDPQINKTMYTLYVYLYLKELTDAIYMEEVSIKKSNIQELITKKLKDDNSYNDDFFKKQSKVIIDHIKDCEHKTESDKFVSKESYNSSLNVLNKELINYLRQSKRDYLNKIFYNNFLKNESVKIIDYLNDLEPNTNDDEFESKKIPNDYLNDMSTKINSFFDQIIDDHFDGTYNNDYFKNKIKKIIDYINELEPNTKNDHIKDSEYKTESELSMQLDEFFHQTIKCIRVFNLEIRMNYVVHVFMNFNSIIKSIYKHKDKISYETIQELIVTEIYQNFYKEPYTPKRDDIHNNLFFMTLDIKNYLRNTVKELIDV